MHLSKKEPAGLLKKSDVSVEKKRKLDKVLDLEENDRTGIFNLIFFNHYISVVFYLSGIMYHRKNVDRDSVPLTTCSITVPIECSWNKTTSVDLNLLAMAASSRI